jgi:hypothetical protein
MVRKVSLMTKWSDGAEYGVGAENAMHVVIGGDEPDPIKDFKAYIMAPIPENLSYDDCARLCAQIILKHFDTFPEDIGAPASDDRKYNHDYTKYTLVIKGLDTLIAEKSPSLDATLHELGLSGFQWGWAVNAAYHIKGVKAVQNPALVVVGG